MSDLENRIEKLEKHTGAGKQQSIIWVVYEGMPEPTEAQRQAAIEAYKAKHPDWQTKDIIVIEVVSENAKQLTERIIAGEGTEK